MRSNRRPPDANLAAMTVDRLGALLLALLVVSACGGGGTTTTATPAVTTTAAGTTTTAGVIEAWVWGVAEVELGDGYLLGPCEGDANLIACITKDGAVIGSAESLALDAQSFEALDGVDDPVESIEIIAGDYLSTFAEDRQSTCPGLEFRELRPVAVNIAGVPGLRYGFEERDGGRVVEKNLIYGVRVDDNINLYNFSAIADGACLSNEGELTDSATLDRLVTALDRVMATVESG